MLEKLESRAAQLAAGTVARVKARLVAAAEAEVPGVRAAEGAEGVVLSGRRLSRRLFDDPRLRWIAGWLR